MGDNLDSFESFFTEVFSSWDLLVVIALAFGVYWRVIRPEINDLSDWRREVSESLRGHNQVSPRELQDFMLETKKSLEHLEEAIDARGEAVGQSNSRIDELERAVVKLQTESNAQKSAGLLGLVLAGAAGAVISFFMGGPK